MKILPWLNFFLIISLIFILCLVFIKFDEKLEQVEGVLDQVTALKTKLQSLEDKFRKPFGEVNEN